LKFIGKILSVFTHEVNNHLAIIKESVGLIEDILRMQKSSSELEESLKIIQSVESQIGKTSWLCKKLNGFGHRMDNSLSTFSVNETLEELLVLLSRIANQKNISFVKDFQENIPTLHSDPARLQFLIFCLIEEGLKSLDRNSRIIIKTEHSSNAVTISIILEGDSVKADENGICPDEISQYITEQLGGSIYRETSGKGAVVTLPAFS
jgi:C4-dicarboxylate-specific signal transduction histidine kinase